MIKNKASISFFCDVKMYIYANEMLCLWQVTYQIAEVLSKSKIGCWLLTLHGSE